MTGVRGIHRNLLLRLVASTLVTFSPIYLVERLTNYYYFTGDKGIYFTFSGLRIELFIALVLLGSITAGLLFRDLWPAVVSQTAALFMILSLVYVFCNPRVCYSTGPDGLEPLRLGLFLGSIAVSGVALGVATRGNHLKSLKARVLVPFSVFFALAYYPVIFTFAGTKLLAPLHPWSVSLLLTLLSYSTTITASVRLGKSAGLVFPLASFGLVVAISVGIATAYLGELTQDVLTMTLGALLGSALGILTLRSEGFVLRHMGFFSGLGAIVLVFVIIMTLVAIPDAVNMLVPQGEASHNSEFTMGFPVYAGGYMVAAPNGTSGIATAVSFAGTNSTSIQNDNYLSAGVGAHSPDCCVDGIDYAYRFDLYLYHDGNESMLASAWQVCDSNAACGGHSWKALMFVRAGPLVTPDLTSPVHLQLEWKNHTVEWSYWVGSNGSNKFASFDAPAKENPAFNIGVLGTNSEVNQQRAAYFFQFGIASRYPLGRGGWSVTFSCPSTFNMGGWECVGDARTLQGGGSYWKVLWKWGEDYPKITATRLGNHTFSLSYSPTSTMGSFQPLIVG